VIPMTGVLIQCILRACFRTPVQSQLERSLDRHLDEVERQRLKVRSYYAPDVSIELPMYSAGPMHRLALTNS
jgi:hypothetical protein